MIGNGIYSALKDKYFLILIYRDSKKIKLLDKKYGTNKNRKLIRFDICTAINNPDNLEKLVKKIGKIDAIINCAGIINKHSDNDILKTFFVNSVFPHMLSRTYKEKLIHITTDCVFNGKKGFPYTEKSCLSVSDSYGMSKWLGEPKESLVLRTSTVGHEIANFAGLLEWTKKQKGNTIKGFANQYWNGVTNIEMGKICDRIIENRKNFPENGIYHIFGEKLSKYEMLKIFNKKYNLGCTILKDTSVKCNRSLETIYGINKKLKNPKFNRMLEELN